MYDRYQSRALKTRLAHPADLRHRRRARPQQRDRRRRSSRTTSASAARATRIWSRKPRASPRKRCGPRASIGPSRPASPSRRTSAGAGPTKASRRPGRGEGPRRGRDARPARQRAESIRCPSSPAPSTSSATAAPRFGTGLRTNAALDQRRHPRRRSHAPPHPPAGLHRRHRRRRRHRSCLPTAVGTA